MRRWRATIDRLQASVGRVTRHWKAATLLVVLLLVLSVENPPPLSMEARVDRELTGQQFDFVTWEIGAIWRKVTHGLVAPEPAE